MAQGKLRSHEPLVIEQFGGWWQRGDNETAPSDHFTTAENVQYFASGVETRDPLDKYEIGATTPIGNVLRVYDYVMQTGQSLLVLVEGGIIHHVTKFAVHLNILGPIPAMNDFGFVAIAGRAYITPFHYYQDAQGQNYELGIQNEFVYVYKGDGTPARKAAGAGPPALPQVTAVVGTSCAILGLGAQCTDPGDHVFGVVFETDTGFITAPGALNFGPYGNGFSITYNNIPIGPAGTIKRHLVSSKLIPFTTYNGDLLGYQLFFIPEGTIDNNIDTSKADVHFFDADLIEDASHLIDNFTEIPSGVNLNTYHSRMVLVGEYGIPETLKDLPVGQLDNRSIARVSHPGEPEAISKVDGLIIAPLDGNPLTNVQEFRDILYLFKQSRTFGYSDNGEEPASWEEEVLDQGIGAPVHGIGTVLDSGGVNIDFLMIADWSGLMAFNGTYARPEMSWKIEDFWLTLIRNLFRHIQIVNDSLAKKIWITLPPPFQNSVLLADYGQGLDAKNIRWARWIFDAKISTITLIETKRLVMGALGLSGSEDAAAELNLRNSD